MSEEKRQLIRDVTTRINKLPEDKQHYILGYMNGVADTVESNTQKEETTIRDSNQRGDDITEQLIPINYSSEQPTVSARELYAGLEITDRFSRWFERMSAYGFAEGSDFTSVKSSTLVNNGAEREISDYQVSIDMAKQICMIQRSEKGRQYRQYFIDLEKAWNTPEQIFARALKMADQTIAKLKDTNKSLVEKIEADRPKTIFADAVSASHTSILIGDLAKLICQNGYQIGQKRLFQWMRDNGYLMVSGSLRNMPKQKYVEQGLFEIKESNVQNPDGSVRITRTTKVSGKGQLYFVNKFLGREDRENEQWN